MTSDTALPVELLPCPHCGAKPYPHVQNSSSHVEGDPSRWLQIVWCHDCGAVGPHRNTEAEAITAWNTRALSAARTEPPTHRHKKRGSEYVLIGIGKMQTESWVDMFEGGVLPVDMAEVAIYRDVKDGSLWARPREEFQDGRFEPLSTTEGE